MNVHNLQKYKNIKLKWIKNVRKIIRATILCYTLVFLITSYEEFSPKSLERAFSYIVTASRNNDLMNDIEIKSTNATKILPFKNGMVKCDKDFLSYLNAVGSSDQEIPLAYQNPDMVVGNNHVITYDRNGVDYNISNSFGTLYTGKATSAILQITSNNNDDYVMITDEIGYVSAVTMFDKSNAEIFKWYTSNYNIVNAKVSNNGSKIALSCIYQEGIEFSSKIIVFDTKSGDELWANTYTSSFPIDFEFLDNGNIVCIFNDGVKIITSSGNEVYTSKNEAISAYNIENAHNIVFETSSRIITVVNKNGTELASREFSQDINSYSVLNDGIYVLSNAKVYSMTLSLEDLFEIDVPVGIKKLMLHRNGFLYGIYSNKIIKLM